MDASQWPQVGLQVRPMEEIGTTPNNSATMNQRAPPQVVGERRARPQKDQNLNCPRCNSTNTKFCYYNNYSLTQPRYFCKTCRRYWTQGGSLRNVPVGGGSRKNKRSTQPTALSSSSPMINIPSSSTPASTNLIPDLNPPVTCSLTQLITSSQNPKLIHEGQDLNLSFPIHGQDYHGIFQPIGLPKIESENNNNNNNSVTSCSTSSTATITNNSTPPISALELLRSGMASRGVLNSYVPIPMPDSNALYPSGFHNLQEFKPNLGSFGGDANIGGPRFSVGGVHEQESNINGGGARLLFPFADMNKLASATTNEANAPNEVDDQMNGKEQHDHHHQHQHHHHHHHHQGSSGYWNGMLGGGTW